MTQHIESLTPYREKINRVDSSILDLLAQRLIICKEVAHYKKKHQIAMMQPQRVEMVKQRCVDLGLTKGLRPEFIRDLYSLIIGEACEIEDIIIDD